VAVLVAVGVFSGSRRDPVEDGQLVIR
jgi:hypothetical protein